MTPEEREKRRARMRQWYAKNPEKRAQSRAQWRAKMSPEQRAEQRARDNESKRKWYANLTPEQRTRRNDLKRLRRSQVPERERGYRIKQNYGMTLDEWDVLFDSQGKCCVVCRAKDPGTKKEWHTDHCHRTKKVRGILCRSCNIALGLAKDDPDLLRALAAYIEQYK